MKTKIHEFLKQEIEISRASLDFNGRPLRTRWERSSSDRIEGILDDYDRFFFMKKQSGIDVKNININLVYAFK
jgi:hypothetical protein